MARSWCSHTHGLAGIRGCGPAGGAPLGGKGSALVMRSSCPCRWLRGVWTCSSAPGAVPCGNKEAGQGGLAVQLSSPAPLATGKTPRQPAGQPCPSRDHAGRPGAVWAALRAAPEGSHRTLPQSPWEQRISLNRDTRASGSQGGPASGVHGSGHIHPKVHWQGHNSDLRNSYWNRNQSTSVIRSSANLCQRDLYQLCTSAFL